MKKICYVTTIPATLQSFVVPAAQYLLQHTDWEITFICDYDETFAKELPDGIRYIPVSMKRGISLSGISAMLQMVKVFKQEKFDLVQYSTPNAALYASMASWLSGVKIRKYHLMGFRYLGLSGITQRIFHLIERFACSLSTEIECVSCSNLEFGIKEHIFPKEKAHVILRGSSSGVDLARFDITRKEAWRSDLRQKFGYSNQDCVFGFAGRITGDKGINELLEAFLSNCDPEQKLFLVGNIEREETLDAQLLKKARSDPRISWHPYVPDIERYYAMMDILVLPSYREGFGNIIIEAEAMGVPVIVTEIPGPIDAMLPDVTGLTIPPQNPSALYHAIGKMKKNPAMRKKMGCAGRDFVEQYFDQRVLFPLILSEMQHSLEER